MRNARLVTYDELVKPLLSAELFHVFQLLNHNVYIMADWIEQQNTDALTEILQQLDGKVTRKELRLLMLAYEEKQKRIAHLKETQSKQLIFIQRNKEKLKQTIKQLELDKQKALKSMDLPASYTPEIQKLLREYVIPIGDDYALRRRFDSNFSRILKKEGIIELREFIWHVNSVSSLAEQLMKRLKNHGAIKWVYEKEKKRSLYRIATDDNYAAVAKYTWTIDEWNQKIKNVEDEIVELDRLIRANEAEMRQARKETIRTYLEAAVISDTLSERELLRHTELQSVALRWLYSKGYIACSEVNLPNGKRADVIGYKDKHVIIIEVKASYNDYKRDNKWTDYLTWCDEFYFLMDTIYADLHKGAGYLEKKGNTLIKTAEDTLQHTCKNQKQIEKNVGRMLSKRYIFGW